MRIIAITTPEFFPGESPLLACLLRLGVDRLHVRKPNADEAALRALLETLPVESRKRISLHDHHALAVELGLGGVHLNRRNPAAPAGFRGIVSRSCHSLAEVERAKGETDYLFLSPIFDSLSKAGYGSRFTIEELRAAGQAGTIDEKVIALGGLSTRTLREALTIPFGGLAFLGALWGDESGRMDEQELTKRYKTIENEIRIYLSGI